MGVNVSPAAKRVKLRFYCPECASILCDLGVRFDLSSAYMPVNGICEGCGEELPPHWYLIVGERGEEEEKIIRGVKRAELVRLSGRT